MADTARPNILFIMTDQQRADCLGCAGHPVLETPHIDALAARGARFTRAFVQAPVCGGSRNSIYTGRYAFSHGGYGNGYPLRPDEMGIGDYLRPLGYRVALAGKTHFVPDAEGFVRLGLDPASGPGALAAQIGFEAHERDDGLYPEPLFDPHLAYNRFLWARGYAARHPWHEIANGAEGPDGGTLSGWMMRHAHLPACVQPEHSETAWMTDRAMAFVEDAGADPWCLHLSYIKPHWPYMAPAPWHALYRDMEVAAPNRAGVARRWRSFAMDQPARELLSSALLVTFTLTCWPFVALSFISTSQYLVRALRVAPDIALKFFCPFSAKPLDGLLRAYASIPGLPDTSVQMASTKFVMSALVGRLINHIEALLSVYPAVFVPVVNCWASSR